MNDPLKQYNALIKATEAIHRQFAPTKQLIDQMSSSSAFLTSHRSGFSEIMLEMQRRQELLDPTLGMQRVIAQIQAAQETADMMHRNCFAVEAIQKQADQWKALIEPAVRRIDEMQVAERHFKGLADSFTTWEATTARLARRFHDTGLIERHTKLAERLFAPSQIFANFARDTVARIEQAADARNRWALETSLRVAEEQLIATTDSLRAFVVPPDDQDEVSVSLELRSPYVQQDELVAAVGEIEDEDESALVQASPAATAADLSRQILMAITTCNEARKVAGREEIFKPTTRLLEVFADMPWLVPTSKKEFASFVDCLYFLFYEGAGKDKLRFLKTQGGPIEDTDFEFVLCIKHLRNKWTRHDADHGKESQIKKSWVELSSKFSWLGLTRMPITDEDFRLLHMSLLAQSLDFAEKILRGVVEE